MVADGYRILLEALNEGALTLAADGTILYANQRLAEMIGRPIERVLGLSLRDLVVPADVGALDALLREAERGGKKGEIALLGPDGAPIPAMASVSVVRQEGEATFAVLFADLGPSKAADALRKANDALEARVARIEGELRCKDDALIEADRRKDEFLAHLSYDLRNPLAPILSATELLRLMRSDPEAIERCRDVIERQASRLARLVDDLLDVSHVTRRAVSLQRQVIELSTVVWSAVESVRPLVDQSGQMLRVALPAEPVRIFADPGRFEQVLVNVLDNAAKYTPRGGFIQLTAEQRGGEAIVRVKDDGLGIPADLLPKIFDLFVQSEGSLGRAQGGLGVGLTVVKRLVEMHGGSVEARSEGPGRGSELTIRVPLAAASGEAAAPAGSGVRRDAE